MLEVPLSRNCANQGNLKPPNAHKHPASQHCLAKLLFGCHCSLHQFLIRLHWLLMNVNGKRRHSIDLANNGWISNWIGQFTIAPLNMLIKLPTNPNLLRNTPYDLWIQLTFLFCPFYLISQPTTHSPLCTSRWALLLRVCPQVPRSWEC